MVKVRVSQFGRVVKAKDLKSFGVTRTGSNPVADVHFLSGLVSLKVNSPIKNYYSSIMATRYTKTSTVALHISIHYFRSLFNGCACYFFCTAIASLHCPYNSLLPFIRLTRTYSFKG